MGSQGKPNTVSRNDSGNGAVALDRPFADMIRTMAMVATADSEETSFSGDDLNSILSAETMEEMWDADERGPLNFQHLAGCDIEILNLTVKFSRGDSEIKTPFVYKDGDKSPRKMYVIVSLKRASSAQDNKLLNLPTPGEVFEANTSARFVVAKLWWMYSKGLLDPENGSSVFAHVEETDLGGGTGVLKLKRMPSRTVAASAE